MKNNLPEETVLIICSGHGNIEATSTKLHTLNKVPLVIYSKQEIIDTHKVKSITDTYNLVSYLDIGIGGVIIGVYMTRKHPLIKRLILEFFRFLKTMKNNP